MGLNYMVFITAKSYYMKLLSFHSPCVTSHLDEWFLWMLMWNCRSDSPFLFGWGQWAFGKHFMWVCHSVFLDYLQRNEWMLYMERGMGNVLVTSSFIVFFKSSLGVSFWLWCCLGCIIVLETIMGVRGSFGRKVKEKRKARRVPLLCFTSCDIFELLVEGETRGLEGVENPQCIKNNLMKNLYFCDNGNSCFFSFDVTGFVDFIYFGCVCIHFFLCFFLFFIF